MGKKEKTRKRIQEKELADPHKGTPELNSPSLGRVSTDDAKRKRTRKHDGSNQRK